MQPRRCPVGSSLVLVVLAGLAFGAGCDDASGSREAFCDAARAVAEANPATVFDRYDPTDPPAATDDLEAAAAQLRQLEAAAPESIADDVGTLAGMAEDLADALTRPDIDSSRQRLDDLRVRFREVEDASRRVTDYARSECGVELDSTSSSVP